MEVEYTARQVSISKALRAQAEEGMERIARILGKSARASITFSAQKRQQRLKIVEITIKARQQTFAAEGQGETMTLALHQAIERAAIPVAYVLAGPLLYGIFRPALAPGGAASGVAGLLGARPDGGIALMFVLMGLIQIVVAVAAIGASQRRPARGRQAPAAWATAPDASPGINS